MSSLPPLPNLRGAVDLTSLVQRAQAPAQTPSQGTTMPGQAPGPVAPGTRVPVPSLVLDGTDGNFTAILDLSAQVPVIVELYAPAAEPAAQIQDVLTRVVLEFGGRLLLARVDITNNPQLVQAFKAQAVPTVAAVIGGQPLQLFEGVGSEEDIRGVLQQVITAGEQNGIAGIAVASDEPAVPAEKPLPPLHQEAFDAAERADYPAAIAAWQKALTQNPNDSEAKAGLAQISLLHRLQGKTMAQVRERAAAHADDLEAQMDVADLDLSGGHVEDAFDRLLTLFPKLDKDQKNTARERLLELFEVVGKDSSAVAAARIRLANLLY